MNVAVFPYGFAMSIVLLSLSIAVPLGVRHWPYIARRRKVEGQTGVNLPGRGRLIVRRRPFNAGAARFADICAAVTAVGIAVLCLIGLILSGMHPVDAPIIAPAIYR